MGGHMHTSSDIQLPAAGRKRGRYSDAFKARLVAACNQPGVSTAAIALANGLNANLLRRWVSQQRHAQGGAQAASDAFVGFVQLTAADPPRAVAALPPTPVGTPGQDRIQLHFSRGELQATLCLPTHQHAQCAALLKLLLS
jgi:transposase